MNINELHCRFQEYGANAKLWVRKCLLLLPEIAKCEVWKVKGFGSIYEYAAKLAGLTQSQVDDALYVLKKIEDKPALLRVVEEKGINAVRPLIGIVNDGNEEFLAGKAAEMSNNTLRTYVKEFKRVNWTGGVFLQNCSDDGGIRDVSKNQSETKMVNMQVPAELAQKLQEIKGGDEWATLMKKFVELYEKNELENAKKLEAEKPSVVKNRSRGIPRKIKKHVLRRSKGKCEFPNCSKKYDHLHHIHRFAINHEHNPDRIVALCRAHHDLVHRSMIENESRGVKNWKIKTAQKWHGDAFASKPCGNELGDESREFTEPEQQHLQFLTNNWFVDHQYRLNQRAS